MCVNGESLSGRIVGARQGEQLNGDRPCDLAGRAHQGE